VNRSAGMTPARTLLFAVAGGAAVGNLYWAQPLLDDIARTLDTSVSLAGLLVTLTQVGYAVGILLVVPLGDVLDRRRLIPGVLVASAVALLFAAVAPSFAVLLVALALVGLTTVAGQLLIPLAGDLAEPASRGRVVGTIASGVLTGSRPSRRWCSPCCSTGWSLTSSGETGCRTLRSSPRCSVPSPHTVPSG